MNLEMPHILTLTSSDGFDPDVPYFWDEATLTCPYNPPTELMPCSVWIDCGCTSVSYEQWNPEHEWVDEAEIDPLINTDDEGPCPRSATGVHHYWEGIPQRPDAECWPTVHADDLDGAAMRLRLPPGRYEVFPSSDGDGGLVLDLAKPIKTAAGAP